MRGHSGQKSQKHYTSFLRPENCSSKREQIFPKNKINQYWRVFGMRMNTAFAVAWLVLEWRIWYFQQKQHRHRIKNCFWILWRKNSHGAIPFALPVGKLYGGLKTCAITVINISYAPDSEDLKPPKAILLIIALTIEHRHGLWFSSAQVWDVTTP